MSSRQRNPMILGAVLIAELLLLTYQVHKGRDLTLIRELPVLAVTPIEKGIRTVSQGVSGFWRHYLYLRDARRENEDLIRELNGFKLDNQRLLTDAEQGKRLQVLLQFKEEVTSETVAAEVISSGGSDTARLLVLDKGEEAGLRPDMAVIVPDGIIGKVLRVFPHAAQVLLLTDLNSGVACVFENSRIHGILKGQNKPLCTVGYVLNDDKVQIGERVFTSGEDRIYPKGLPVGVVVEAHAGATFQEISLQPFAKLNRLEEVLVVTKKVDAELPALPALGHTVAGLSATVPESEHGAADANKAGEADLAASPAPQKAPSASIPRGPSPP